jgi:hypothetical protein
MMAERSYYISCFVSIPVKLLCRSSAEEEEQDEQSLGY